MFLMAEIIMISAEEMLKVYKRLMNIRRKNGQEV